MKFLTLNARGLRNRSKRIHLYGQIRSSNTDVVFIQEAYVTSEDLNLWSNEWKGAGLYAVPYKRNSRGLLMYFSEKCDVNNIKEISVQDSFGRIQLITCRLQNEEFALINVYAPNADNEKIKFFKKITYVVENYVSSEICNLIIAGDMNTVGNNELDNLFGSAHAKSVTIAFNLMIEKLGLIDVWRMHHPNEKGFTWSRHGSHTTRARRLDYVLVNESLHMKSQSSAIIPYSKSDHCIVNINIEINQQKRGPGFWKMNNSLLQNKDYVDFIKGVIKDIKNNDVDLDAQTLWDFCKNEIKHKTIDYACNQANNLRNQKENLREELKVLHKKISIEQKEELFQKYEKVKLDMDKIYEYEANGAQVRSREKWIEKGEKNTSYFLGLEKSRGAKKTIRKLRDGNNKELTESEDIAKYIFNHFRLFFSRKKIKKTVIEEYLNKIKTPVLTLKDREVCEGKLTVEECTVVLNKMKQNTSPGYDGLNTEFYQVFWEDIKNMVVNSLNESLETGRLSTTQRRGVITLLPKGAYTGVPSLNDFRPISLTCCDYKIGAAVLANRLQKVINSIVNSDQTGYIKGRGTYQNIRLLDDIIWYLNVNSLPGALIALDFSKAFDSLSKDFMLEILKKYNFGPEFISWITVLNCDTQSCVTNDGWQTGWFNLECGIRQGCPLSALLFVLSVEICSCNLRQEEDIKGIVFPGEEKYTNIKLSQYADDLTLILGDDISIQNALSTVNEFSKVSGLLLNVKKSNAMWLGKWKERPDQLFDLKWNNIVKILGVYFNNSVSAGDILENWEPKINNIKVLINTWSKRNLSLSGRVIIIKSLLLSQITHLLMSLRAPSDVILQVNNLLYKFLWNKSTYKKGSERVKRGTVIQAYDCGGLNMVDVEHVQRALVASWYKRIQDVLNITSEKPKWCNIPVYLLNKLGPEMAVLKFNCKFSDLTDQSKDIINQMPPFYKLLIETILDNKKLKSKLMSKDIIWNNVCIRYSNDTLFFSDWIKQEIMYVEQIINKDTRSIKTLQEFNRIVIDRGKLMFEYFALCSAITKCQITFDQDKNVNYTESNRLVENILLRKCGSQYYQKQLKLNCHSDPKSESYWNKKFSNIEINWKQVWNINATVNKEAKLFSLQWKILHKIYPTGILLKKFGKVNSEKCKYCEEIDTLEHFFVNCYVCKTIWMCIENKYNVSLNEHIILLGVYDSANVINRELYTIISIAKMCRSKYKYGVYNNIMSIFEKECLLRKVICNTNK